MTSCLPGSQTKEWLLLQYCSGERRRQAVGNLEQSCTNISAKKRGKMFLLLPRIMLPVSALSAFLNNTPVVIIFAPIIKKWAETLNLSHKNF